MSRKIILAAVFIGILTLWVVAGQTDLSVLDKYKAFSGTMDKARSAFEKGDLTGCKRELDKCLKAIPDHHEAHFFKAQLRYKEGDFAKGAEHMTAAENGYIRLMTLIDEARVSKLMKGMDESQALTELIPELEKAYEQSVCKNPKYIAAQKDAEGRLGETKKEKADLLREGGIALPAEYLYFHGNCFFRMKKYPEAEARYKAAIENDAMHVNSYNNLINLLYTEKRYADARAFLDQAEAHEIHVQPGLKKAVLDAAKK